MQNAPPGTKTDNIKNAFAQIPSDQLLGVLTCPNPFLGDQTLFNYYAGPAANSDDQMRFLCALIGYFNALAKQSPANLPFIQQIWFQLNQLAGQN
jgi:hypothetical protein